MLLEHVDNAIGKDIEMDVEVDVDLDCFYIIDTTPV